MEKRFQVLKLKRTVEVEQFLEEFGVNIAADSNLETAQTMERALVAGDDPNSLDLILLRPFIRN